MAHEIVYTGPGTFTITKSQPWDFAAILTNYDINGIDMKPEHVPVLKTRVFPFLKAGGGVSVLGLASTTGDADYDLRLSFMRAQQLLFYLGNQVRTPFSVMLARGDGKENALLLGGRDGQEDAFWRATCARAWNQRTPPIVPMPGMPGDLGQFFAPSLPPIPTSPGALGEWS